MKNGTVPSKHAGPLGLDKERDQRKVGAGRNSHLKLANFKHTVSVIKNNMRIHQAKLQFNINFLTKLHTNSL